MDKPHKKQKHHKTINYKKYINPSFTNFEEYNKAMDIIPKELEKNNEFRDFEEKIHDIYVELRNATNEYCEKIRLISKELNPEDIGYSGKLQKALLDLITISIEELENAIRKFKKDKSKNYKMFDQYTISLEDFSKNIVSHIEPFILTRKDYLEEMKKYEAYLINKELGLIDNKENDDNKKEKKKKNKDKDKNTLIDNHAESYDKQEKYVESKNVLYSYIKNVIVNLNGQRMLLYQSLSHNCFLFYKIIKEGINNLKENLEKIDLYINEEVNKCGSDIIEEKKMINNIIKDELYSFKFLSIDKNNINKVNNEEDESNKKKKKEKKDKNSYLNVDDLLTNINDDNMVSLLDNIQKNNFKLNSHNTEKIGLFKDRKDIERIVDLLLNDPEKFVENDKEDLLKKFSSNTENHYSFMKYLNNYRANGLFELKKKTITILCDLFTFIVEKAIKNNDYRIIQYAFILSLTYCHLDEEENTSNKNKNSKNNESHKIYMSKYLKDSKPLHEKNFWTNYFQSLVIDEEEKIVQRNKNKIDDKKKALIIYSNVFTLVKNMIDYDLDFDFINEILQEIVSKNTFTDNEKSELVNYLMSEIQQKNKNK